MGKISRIRVSTYTKKMKLSSLNSCGCGPINHRNISFSARPIKSGYRVSELWVMPGSKAGVSLPTSRKTDKVKVGGEERICRHSRRFVVNSAHPNRPFSAGASVDVTGPFRGRGKGPVLLISRRVH